MATLPFSFVFHVFRNLFDDKAAGSALVDRLTHFYEGAIEEAELAMYLQLKLREVVSCHTTIAGWFMRGDSRRRTFPNGNHRLTRYELCSKYMDHLISVIPHWLSDVRQLGQELCEVSAAVGEGYEESRKPMEAFLR